jgi:class 3 adenylate cyclase/alpha-beta hydrolase superfamily lysophospholipase
MGNGEPIPKTQFATLDDDRIAYQIFGQGPADLLWVPASGDCIDLRWDFPPYAEFLRWLGNRTRVISFDRRGTGSSDAPSDETLSFFERWADDARAVLDAVGSDHAVVSGEGDSGPTAILFAASQPSRTRALILMNTAARLATTAGYLPGGSEDAVASTSQFVQDSWGTDAMAQYAAPALYRRDPDFADWFARTERLYMSPRQARDVFRLQLLGWDVRDALALVRVPTLVLHSEEAPFPLTADHGQYLSEHIAGARLATLPGRETFLSLGESEALPEIDRFLRELSPVAPADRALAAILFTDIVGSTELASSMGDQAWHNLLDTHDALARTLVEQHRGHLVHASGAMGDGICATFDGPGRAIRCARALNEALRPLGVSIRAGVHAGEIDLRETGIAGIGVHIASRVLSQASAEEVLVSGAVPMLVAGSGFAFEDRGEYELKGVPGTWRLYAVAG